MSEWQPIETAPKDGTPVLICCARDNSPKTLAATWSGEAKYPWLFLDGNETNSMMAGKHGPTHWMPLPEPPK